MYSLRRFGIKLGLEVIKNILNDLGNPQDTFSSIHIAGTNGKGSVASTLATILHCAGFNVGLYTSPHLIRFNERVRINGEMVTDAEIVESYKAVKQARFGDREPTFFEYTTAMAFYEFGRKNVDWAVIETGMGARLDATNILSPKVSIITNISMEHQMYLGNTIKDITFEKAGIIKPKTPVVAGVRQKEGKDVLKRIADGNAAKMFQFKTDFNVRRNATGGFTYFGIDHVWRGLKTGLLGNHQTDNAALALCACELLMRGGINNSKGQITLPQIKRGLEHNIWPGRLQTLSTSPFILVDGAHNLAAIRNLKTFLLENLGGRDLTLVVGILDDKSYKPMLKHLLPLCSRVIITRPKIDRSLAPEALYPVAKQMIPDVRIIPDVPEAVKTAIEAASTGGAVCIAGSLYLVGETMEAIEKGEVNI